MLSRFGSALLAIVLVTAGCDRGPDADTVAQAGDFRLGVEDAAAFLVDHQQLPPQEEVVEALAELWLDYTLLARVSLEDPGFESVDLSGLVQQEVEQRKVLELRDRVIEVDEDIPDEELRRVYEEDGIGERVRARHILFTFPTQADDAQRDSVLDLASSVREQILAGEDFGALAREHSDDPGSAQEGGDLGFFGRGEMTDAFEETAFALETGELSEPVETPFGVHIIRTDERELPDFEDVRDDIREDLEQRRTFEAESLYVAAIEEPAGMEVQEGAVERVREVAEDPARSLSGREADRTLVEYRDGAYTVGEFRQFLLLQAPDLRGQIQQVPDQQIEQFLLDLTRGKLLVDEARREGIEVSDEEREETAEEIRAQYLQVAGILGLDAIEVGEDETPEEAVRRAVEEVLQRVVTGEQDVFPLGALAGPLRVAMDGRISPAGVERAAERIADLRGTEAPDTEAPMPVPGELPEGPPAGLPDAPPGEEELPE